MMPYFLVNWAVFWIQKEFLFFLGQICDVHWIRNKKNTWANLHFTFTCFLCLSVSRYWPLVNFPGPDHCLQAFRELTYVGWYFFLWWYSTFLGKSSKKGLFDDLHFSFPPRKPAQSMWSLTTFGLSAMFFLFNSTVFELARINFFELSFI